MRFPVTTDLKNAARITRIEGWLLVITILIECATYQSLTIARYAGQGLQPTVLPLSSRSDVISLLVFAFILILLAREIFLLRSASLLRTIVIVSLSILTFWLTLGVRNFEVGEFPRAASIFFLFLRALFIALLASRRIRDLNRLSSGFRIIANSLISLGIAILATFFYSFTYDVYSDFTELKRYDADAGVILGAAVWHGSERGERPSPALSERIRVGAELLKQKVVTKLAVTGSNAPNEKSEALIAKEELIKLGIDPSVIAIESNSHSTIEQILFIRNELQNKQGWKKFIIISDQYHLPRVLEMAKFNSIAAIGAPSNINQNFFDLFFYRLRESVALLAYWLLGK